MDEQAQAILELAGRFDRLMDGIDAVKERQEEMADDIAEIKKAVYHPDAGIYARIRELESWKATSSRLIWLIIASVVGLASAAMYAKIIIN
jgi:hypothetical protein